MEENLDSSQTTLKPIRAKRRITVHQPITGSQETKLVSFEKNIKTFFFVKQGPTKIDIKLEREACYSDDKAIL